MNYFDLMEEHIQKIRKASGVTIENDISEQHRRMARQYFEAKENQAEREKLKKEIIKELTPALAKELKKSSNKISGNPYKPRGKCGLPLCAFLYRVLP